MNGNRIKKYLNRASLSIAFAALISCSKADLQVPGQLQKVISMNQDCTCDPYLDQYSWSEEVVYVLAYRGPACDTRVSYYNELGKEIKMDPGYTHPDFLRDGRFVKNIWTCK